MYYALEMTLCKLDKGIAAFNIQVPKENPMGLSCIHRNLTGTDAYSSIRLNAKALN